LITESSRSAVAAVKLVLASIHLSIAGRKYIPVVGSADGKPRLSSSGSFALNASKDRCIRRAALIAGMSRGSTRYLICAGEGACVIPCGP
jgi:hypothetical protein